MVLGDNSLTVQHAHIYVHKWEDEDEENETGELPEPVLESVPLRCSPAINVSSRSAHATTSDSGIPPQHEASTSSSGRVPGPMAIGLSSDPPSFRPGSLLTAALRMSGTNLQASSSLLRTVVALRPLEDTLVTPEPEHFIDITDRGARRTGQLLHAWQSEGSQHGEGSGEFRVHGIGSAYWLINEGSGHGGVSDTIRPSPNPRQQQNAFNITATCCAAALLANPTVFRSIGYIFAVAILSLLCALSYSCGVILMRHAQHYPHWCFGWFPSQTMGRPWAVCSAVAVTGMCWFLTLLYLSVLGDVLFEPDSGLLVSTCMHDNCITARSVTGVLVVLLTLAFLPSREWGNYGPLSLVVTLAAVAFVAVLLVTALWGVVNDRSSGVGLLPFARVSNWTELSRDLSEICYTLPNVLFAFCVNQNIKPLMRQYHGLSSEHVCQMSFKGSMGWSMATACAVYAIAGLASCVVMDSNVPGTHLNFRDDLIIANLEFVLLSSRSAVVINIILRLLYTVLLLASIPLAMWPIEDHLRLALDAAMEWWHNTLTRQEFDPDMTAPLLTSHGEQRSGGWVGRWLQRRPELWQTVSIRSAMLSSFAASICASRGASALLIESMPVLRAVLGLLLCTAALVVSLVVPAGLALLHPLISTTGSEVCLSALLGGEEGGAWGGVAGARVGSGSSGAAGWGGLQRMRGGGPSFSGVQWGSRQAEVVRGGSGHGEGGGGGSISGRGKRDRINPRSTARCALAVSAVIWAAAFANLVLECQRLSANEGSEGR